MARARSEQGAHWVKLLCFIKRECGRPPCSECSGGLKRTIGSTVLPNERVRPARERCAGSSAHTLIIAELHRWSAASVSRGALWLKRWEAGEFLKGPVTCPRRTCLWGFLLGKTHRQLGTVAITLDLILNIFWGQIHAELRMSQHHSVQIKQVWYSEGQ